MKDMRIRPRGGFSDPIGDAAPLSLVGVKDLGRETIMARCPLCGRPCVLGRTSGPVPEVHTPWSGVKGSRESCRWIAMPDPVGGGHGYVPVPDGDRLGDWLERLRADWEERYRVRSYLTRRSNGTDG